MNMIFGIAQRIWSMIVDWIKTQLFRRYPMLRLFLSQQPAAEPEPAAEPAPEPELVHDDEPNPDTTDADSGTPDAEDTSSPADAA